MSNEATLRDALNPVNWSREDAGTPPAYVVCMVLDGVPFAYPYIDAIEAETFARSCVSRGRAVTVCNLSSYRYWTLEGAGQS